jgi:predicted outer membrane repeat protein
MQLVFPMMQALAQNQPVADWAALAASLENWPGTEDFRVVLQPSSVVWNVDREITVKGGNKTAKLFIDGGNNTLTLTQSYVDYLKVPRLFSFLDNVDVTISNLNMERNDTDDGTLAVDSYSAHRKAGHIPKFCNATYQAGPGLQAGWNQIGPVYGGIICKQGGRISLENVGMRSISTDIRGQGGGLAATDSTVVLNNVSIVNFYGFYGAGGALFINSDVAASKSKFAGNQGSMGQGTRGGNLLLSGCKQVLIEDSEILGVGGEGGVWVEDSNVRFARVQFDSNSGGDAQGGGALAIVSSDVSAVMCNFTNNRVHGLTHGKIGGGAVLVGGIDEGWTKPSNFTAVDCAFIQNTAETTGGAIQVSNDGHTVVMERVTFLNNTAGPETYGTGVPAGVPLGGAVFFGGSKNPALKASCVNCTCEGNMWEMYNSTTRVTREVPNDISGTNYTGNATWGSLKCRRL